MGMGYWQNEFEAREQQLRMVALHYKEQYVAEKERHLELREAMKVQQFLEERVKAL